MQLLQSILKRSYIDQALELVARYQRVEVEGLEHLPKDGPAILLPNHSGFFGFDALLLSHLVRRHRNRVPRILLHKLWFAGGLLEKSARNLGFLEATYANGLAALERNKFVMLFPEAEEGNFKPINEKYRLREFRKGFVRMAARTGAPVVPVLIIGAEETHINLGQVKILNQLLPLPLNYFPLPAKWKIKFLPPLKFAGSPESAMLEHKAEKAAAVVRRDMQAALKKELAQRKYVYLDNVL
jgi:1-acyl-sn-glycerol-3-phosphate acyltransferase